MIAPTSDSFISNDSASCLKTLINQPILSSVTLSLYFSPLHCWMGFTWRSRESSISTRGRYPYYPFPPPKRPHGGGGLWFSSSLQPIRYFMPLSVAIVNADTSRSVHSEWTLTES